MSRASRQCMMPWLGYASPNPKKMLAVRSSAVWQLVIGGAHPSNSPGVRRAGGGAGCASLRARSGVHARGEGVGSGCLV
jgi:hypothetical protein